MCDTFGIMKDKYNLFAKNSDRSSNEVQVLEYVPGSKHKEETMRLTYIEIPQVETTYSILISRPTWMWGAEIGVNEFGVCIGNEAIFTKRKDKEKESLTGMDILRLALERSKTAIYAVKLIEKLLKKYNQGGNCAYDHKFLYDNSFIVMDFNEMYVVETYGDKCTYKKIHDREAISNEYILKHVYPKDKLVTRFSGATKRRNMNLAKLKDVETISDCYKLLRNHDCTNYKNGTVSSVCMHEGGLVGDHTTSSMVIRLDKETKDIDIYFTGTSTPCQSVFKYYHFGDKVEYPISEGVLDKSYFLEREHYFREKVGYVLTSIEERDKLENRIIDKKMPLKKSIRLESEFYSKSEWISINTSFICNNHWKKKNKALRG